MEPRTACNICARAKRKCGRQTPACARCGERGLTCTYPSPRPTNFVLLDSDFPPSQPRAIATPASSATIDYLSNSPPAAPTATDIAMTTPTAPLSMKLVTTAGRNHLALISPDKQQKCPLIQPDPTSSKWFLSPDTWKVDHPPFRVAATFPTAMLKRYADRIQRWLARWVREGSCPFIHATLYRYRFPRCAQLAYTTLSAYLDRTDANTDLVLRIVEDRVNELLLTETDHCLEEATSTAPSLDVDVDMMTSCSHPTPTTATSTENQVLDPLEQLARVHALMVYQSIALYDGDIRARHLAEGRIHILNRWVAEMLGSASTSSAFSNYNSSNGAPADPLQPSGRTGSTVETVWHTWILAESIRRTWLVSTGLQTVYLMMQQTWSPCPGGVMLTAKQGVWDAGSSFAWQKMCLNGNIGFMQRFEMERFFTEARPGDVDEFCQGAMESAFGMERMERWVG
ncbi:hypothetical protein B0H66DRAFT_307715 [Apodospora peruviana]|uniref:Zn(2)-C6 fungal-type domain-containing protein n=1 Tax=Apodospora peruviana TaxID=516989 RepID=A0AAE0I1K9_9PEZI|nr:hypothetical protein B0H66DRAFT_307715 [Apodospora peruviana]